jgi:DNA-binding MarR family transcriptional regulator
MQRKTAQTGLTADDGAFYVPGDFPPDQSVGYLMRNVISSIREQANRELAAHDLTYVQWLPLYKLATREGNTVASLARDLEIDAGAMTRSMDRLEAKGLVRRERSTTDRRVVFLMLTADGRKVAKKVPPVLSQVLNGHLKGFSHAEWQQMLQFLHRMLANGQALREGSPQ